jgi:hypothetical protein
MTQTNIDPENSPQSNAAYQLLALVLSVGTHYIVASNLGLFGKLNPVKLVPVGGTVKAVNLNPSEQSRIPEAAKAKPLTVAPTQPVVSSTTRAASSGPNPGVFLGNTPKTSQAQPSASATPKTKEIDAMPKPSRTIKKNNLNLGFDQSKKVTGFRKSPSFDPSDSRGESRRSSRRASESTQDNLNSSASSSQRNNTLATQKTPAPSPKTTPSPTVTPTPTPTNSPGSEFNQRVRNEIEAGIPYSDKTLKVEERSEIFSTQNYPPNTSLTPCNKKTKTYFVLVILHGTLDIELSTFVTPKDSTALSALEEGISRSNRQQKNRSASVKESDKGKAILYKFKFEYAANSCNNRL